MNQKRRSQIAQMLEEQQAITNKELMDCFGISIETVRRDLAYLEKKGLLSRVYGGAVKKEVARTEPLYANRQGNNGKEKADIAEATQTLIKENDIVFFDLGTTVEALKEAISERIKTKADNLVGNMASQGTTPRQLTDLIGSLCDLTSGSGDKGTPVVLVQGYFDNLTD